MTPEGNVAGVDADTKGLLDAVLLISSDLDLRGALDRLVRASCALTGAKYGFLGLLDDRGVIADFVLHGMTPEQIAAMHTLPTGKGILGVLIEDPEPLRLTDLSAHPRSVGFPENHPPMHSFLGVPVRVEGELYGNLYLTEKEGGEPFSESDEIVLDVLARVAGFVIGNARTHADTERRHRWLEACVAMSGALEDSVDVEVALEHVAAHLSAVAEADLVAVVEHEGTVVAAEYGPVSRRIRDALSGRGLEELIARVRPHLAVTAGGPRVVARFDGLTVLLVPMASKLATGHSLVVVLEDSRLGVEGPDLRLFAMYADQASLALDRTQALSERQEHMLVADRDRIARDLHDTVIQRIFATGLQLQGLRKTVLLDEVKDQLDSAVGELNTTIRDIRSTIFELERPGGASLDADVRALAREYVPVLGFTPFVRLSGEVAAASAEAADHLIATLREALSNVARHADADACLVEVDCSEGWLSLRVSDNGRGLGNKRTESGLRNVRRRAQDLGGRFAITSENPQGALLEWKVPLVQP